MSFAAEHPVTCSRKADLGCAASYPASKWDAMRAAREGWFGQKDGTWFCPEHTPDWVAAWRARQPKMKITHSRNPASAACSDCPWDETEADESADAFDLLKDAARDHARAERHEVLVTTSQQTAYRVD